MGADGFFRSISFFLRIEKRERAQLAERESDLEENETKSLLSFDYLFFFIFFFQRELFR